MNETNYPNDVTRAARTRIAILLTFPAWLVVALGYCFVDLNLSHVFGTVRSLWYAFKTGRFG